MQHVAYYGDIKTQSDKWILTRPCVITTATPEVHKLIVECWNFKKQVEFLTQGQQFVKHIVKNGVKWYIKIRFFKIYKLYKDQNQTGQEPKIEQLTTSHLLEISLISPHAGQPPLHICASQVLKSFSDQLKPLVNLEKVY